MPLHADRRALHAVLSALVRVIGVKRNAATPILDTVRIAATRGASEATLTATNLTTTLSASVPISGEAPLDACIDAKAVARILKPQGRTAKGEVMLDPADDHGITVNIDAMSTKLPGVEGQSFPATIGHDIPDDLWTHMALWSASELREALRYVVPAASRDPTRTHLGGVFIDSARNTMVATDGSRLHKTPLPSPWHGTQILIPTAAAELLERILGADEFVALSVARGVLRARHGRWSLTTKLVDARFPPWEMVVPRPDDAQIRVSVEASMLVSALARVARATGGHASKWRVNGAINLSSWSEDAGEAALTVPVLRSTHHGEGDLVIGLDTRYVKDALAGATTAELRFNSGLDPVRIDSPGERCCVVMPLRI